MIKSWVLIVVTTFMNGHFETRSAGGTYPTLELCRADFDRLVQFNPHWKQHDALKEAYCIDENGAKVELKS